MLPETLKTATIFAREAARCTAFTNAFVLPGNQHVTASYAAPVNLWNEISRAFEPLQVRAKKSEKGIGIETADARITCAGGAFALTDAEGNRLEWQIIGGKETQPEIAYLPDPKFEPRTLEEALNFPQACCVVACGEVFDGVTLQLRAAYGEIKDEFLFADADAVREIVFSLRFGALSPKWVAEEETFLLCDAEGTPVLTLPKPFAVDAAGKPVSVTVTLTPGEAGSAQLCWRLDKEQAAAAAYPVMLDPVVYTKNQRCSMEDAYTCSKQASTTHKGTSSNLIRLTNNSSSWGVCNCYFRFDADELPKLSESDYVSQALMSVTQAGAGYPTAAFKGLLYEVTGNWSPASLTWNNAPTNAAQVLDYSAFTQSEGEGVHHAFDITNLVRKWYSAANYGVVLKASSETYAQLRSSAYTQNTSNRPIVVIQYLSKAGVEDYFAYDQQALGRSGEGAVNLFLGSLTYTHSDTVMQGARLPVSVSHVYNSCYRGIDPFGMGFGWKLNMNQVLRKEIISSTTYYTWVNAGGTEIYFSRRDNVWQDELGKGLKLTFSEGRATITDRGGTQHVFDTPTAGFGGVWTRCKPLLYVQDAATAGNEAAQQNRIVFTNNGICAVQITAPGDRITEIVSGADCVEINGEHDAERAPNRALWAMNAGTAQSVTYVDGTHTAFTYDANALLTSVTTPDGRKIEYTYLATAPYRVQSAKLSATAEGVTTLLSHKTYDYKDTYTVVRDELSGKALTYHFNAQGCLVSVNDELGYGLFTEYGTAEAILTKPVTESRLQRAMSSPLRQPFPTGSAGETSAWSPSDFDRDTTDMNLGAATFKGTASESNSPTMAQSAPLQPKKTYTLSWYAKADAGITVHAAMENTGSGICYAGAYPVQSSTEYLRYAHTFRTDALTETLTFTVRLTAAGTGTIRLNGIQLEEGAVPDRLNLVSNGDFIAGMSDWKTPSGVTAGTIISTTAKPEGLSDKALRLTGGGAGVQRAHYQDIYVGGSKGDNYVLGGWATSNSIPRSSGRTVTLLSLSLHYYNGSTEVGSRHVQLNENARAWHLKACASAAPENYTRLRVYVHYNNNYNTASFGGIFLYRERFGASYTYDSEGRIIAAKDAAGMQDDAQYDDYNNLTSYRQAGRTETTTLSYGETAQEQQRRLLKTITAPLGTKTDYAHNTFGSVTETVLSGNETTANIRTAAAYDAGGHFVTSQTDARGNTVTYTTDQITGTTSTVTDAKGQTVSYAYDAMKRVTQTLASTAAGTCTNRYAYENDRLTEVRHNTDSSTDNDVIYHFAYDAAGRPTTVAVGPEGNTQTLSATTYNAQSLPETVTYGNSSAEAPQQVRSLYDDYNRLTGVTYDGADEPRFTYTYGNHGNISQVIDHERGVTVRAEYDLSGRPARKTISKAGESPSLDEHIYTGEVTYDTYGNVASFTEKAGETREAHTTTFTYDIENRPTELSYDGEVTLGYTYDALGRITARTLTQAENDQTTSYIYVPGADENGTTALVQSISQLGSTLSYTYDEVGSISSVSDGSQTVTYTYDTLGQLIRADDPHDPTAGDAGTTWCYSYDLGGNILSKTAYAYTTGTVGPAVQTDTYTYGDANWKDKLTAFNGTTITYDPIGNPLNDSTHTYTWQHGRQLAGMNKLDGSQTVVFEYNEDGLRTKKTVNGVVTNYILHGSNLVHMTRGDDVLHFFYDAQNSPAALLYNGDWFAYVKNLQGDIIGIVNASGTKVVEYGYDAWGKPISVTGTMAGTLGAINPFRYRGYMYDDETGLYYLRSRYYNPIWVRFINADTVFERNLFAYCSNSPVIQMDKNGQSPSSIVNSFLEWVKKALSPSARTPEAVLTKGRKGKGTGNIPVNHLLAYLDQMVQSGDWKYKSGMYWKAVDCVGMIRIAYQQYSQRLAKHSETTVGGMRKRAIEEGIEILPVTGNVSSIVPGMAIYWFNPEHRNAKGNLRPWYHIGVYVGVYYDTSAGQLYKDAVIEAAVGAYNRVTVRSLGDIQEGLPDRTSLYYGFLPGVEY